MMHRLLLSLMLVLNIVMICDGFPGSAVFMSTRTNTPRSRSKLYKARYPLEGAPPQLRLHVAVIVQEASDREVEGDKENGHAGESLVLFDFLPEEPTALATTTRLLSGGAVNGNLRERKLRFLPRGAVYVGESHATLEDMRRFVSSYPDRLSLVTNSCLTFVDAFIARHKSS